MTFQSFQVVYYTSIFILPGYIIEQTTGTFIPSRSYSDWIKAIRCLIYSIINCAVWSWAYILITDKFTQEETLYWLLGTVVTIFGALFLGIIIGLLKKLNPIRSIFGHFKIQLEHPVPTAWDFKFSESGCRYIIIDMKDGSTIYGKYGSQSFASSISVERDIYLEEVYSFTENKPWEPIPRSDGILVKWSDIQDIVFYHDHDIQKGDETYGKKPRKLFKRRIHNKGISTNKEPR